MLEFEHYPSVTGEGFRDRPPWPVCQVTQPKCRSGRQSGGWRQAEVGERRVGGGQFLSTPAELRAESGGLWRDGVASW